ncbi:MAG: hypothetical protein LBQ27_05165 [Clostridiales bacterium]|jgi:hypothetical protein|nr:hypothetical protein [Clostridiales bacterium]
MHKTKIKLKITDTGKNYYEIEPSRYVLGPKGYGHTVFEVERPAAETELGSALYMTIHSAKYFGVKLADIAVGEDNEVVLDGELSNNDGIYVSFRFSIDNYLKATETRLFRFSTDSALKDGCGGPHRPGYYEPGASLTDELSVADPETEGINGYEGTQQEINQNVKERFSDFEQAVSTHKILALDVDYTATYNENTGGSPVVSFTITAPESLSPNAVHVIQIPVSTYSGPISFGNPPSYYGSYSFIVVNGALTSLNQSIEIADTNSNSSSYGTKKTVSASLNVSQEEGGPITINVTLKDLGIGWTLFGKETAPKITQILNSGVRGKVGPVGPRGPAGPTGNPSALELIDITENDWNGNALTIIAKTENSSALIPSHSFGATQALIVQEQRATGDINLFDVKIPDSVKIDIDGTIYITDAEPWTGKLAITSGSRNETSAGGKSAAGIELLSEPAQVEYAEINNIFVGEIDDGRGVYRIPSPFDDDDYDDVQIEQGDTVEIEYTFAVRSWSLYGLFDAPLTFNCKASIPCRQYAYPEEMDMSEIGFNMLKLYVSEHKLFTIPDEGHELYYAKLIFMVIGEDYSLELLTDDGEEPDENQDDFGILFNKGQCHMYIEWIGNKPGDIEIEELGIQRAFDMKVQSIKVIKGERQNG